MRSSIISTYRSEAAASVVRFELELLSELGFGLDLEACAATGSAHDLAHVSPKSGRAVSRTAGEPWQHRLLQFPAFLVASQSAAPTWAELADAFVLTGFFLERRVPGTARPDIAGRAVSFPSRRCPDTTGIIAACVLATALPEAATRTAGLPTERHRGAT